MANAELIDLNVTVHLILQSFQVSLFPLMLKMGKLSTEKLYDLLSSAQLVRSRAEDVHS